MADRIVVLHRGVVQQVGPPEQLYRYPKNRFVARFIGTPAMNLIAGEVSGGRFSAGPWQLSVPGAADGPATLGLRAEHIRVHPGGRMSGVVTGVEPVGESGYLHLAVAGVTLDAAESAGTAESPRRGLLCASVPGREAFGYHGGETVRFDLAEDRLVLFDPKTGAALG